MAHAPAMKVTYDKVKDRSPMTSVCDLMSTKPQWK